MCASVGAAGLYQEVEGGGEGGYRQELLVRELTPLEQTLLLCRECGGLMRGPCFRQHGEGEGEEGQVGRTVAELMIQCPLFGEGCEWVGPTPAAEPHFRECEYKPRSCVFAAYGCRALIPRGKIEAHMREGGAPHLQQLMEQVGRHGLQLEKARIETEVLRARYTDLEASLSQQIVALRAQLSAAEISSRIRGEGFCWVIHGAAEQIRISSKLWSPCFYVDEYKFQAMAVFGHEGTPYMALFLCLVRGERDQELEWPFRLERDKFVFSLRNNSGTDVQLLTVAVEANSDNYKRPETGRNKARGTSELVSLAALSAEYCQSDAVSLRVCLRSKTDAVETLGREVQALLRSQEIRGLGYIWRVEGVARMIADKREEWGPAFYVGRYLFQPSVRFHCGSLPNMGLYIALFRGPYDSELSWPFRLTSGRFVFAVLDSTGHEAVASAIPASEKSHIFSRPEGPRNPAYGSANLISHESLLRESFLVEDSVCIKIVIRSV